MTAQQRFSACLFLLNWDQYFEVETLLFSEWKPSQTEEMFLTIEVMGQILNCSWFWLPRKWNISNQPRLQPHLTWFSQDITTLSCLCFQTESMTPPHIVVSRDTVVSRSQRTTCSLSRPGAVLAAMGLTCGPKAKDTEKQCKSTPVPFITQCQLPVQPRICLSWPPILTLLLHSDSLCFGDLASPLTFLWFEVLKQSLRIPFVFPDL